MNKFLYDYVVVVLVLVTNTPSTEQFGSFIGATIHGASLETTTPNVTVTHSVPTARRCSIDIQNYRKDIELSEPKVFVERGSTKIPPSEIISPGGKEICVFQKAPGTATGSYGVLTYKMNKITLKDQRMYSENDGTTIVVMWGVPWEWRWYSNWHAIGIWDHNPTVNYELFHKLYYGHGDFVRNEAGKSIAYEKLIYDNINIKITTTMDDKSLATFNITIT